MNTADENKEAISRLQNLEGRLRNRIRGQDQALTRIVSVLQRGELNLTKGMRPRGSFLFLGLTGVGKTDVTLACDSALAESFVATLKTECFGEGIPASKAAARFMFFDYIESFYNRRRRHSALGFRSPEQFENDLASSVREGCSGGGSQGGETCPTSRSAPAALTVKNSAGSGGGVIQAAGNNPFESPLTFPVAFASAEAGDKRRSYAFNQPKTSRVQ